MMPNTIQLQEYSKGGDIDGASYIPFDGYSNVWNVGHDNDNGRYLNGWNLNPSNRLNADDLVALRLATHFISPSPFRRGSFAFSLIPRELSESVRSTRRVSVRFHQAEPKRRRTSAFRASQLPIV